MPRDRIKIRNSVEVHLAKYVPCTVRIVSRGGTKPYYIVAEAEGDKHEEALANAHLMAASKRMRDVCQMIVNTPEACNSDLHEAACQALAAARPPAKIEDPDER